MTWRADEILARATPPVLRAIEGDDLLAPFAYLLENPSEERGLRYVDGLPPEGLVVVRPVGDPNDQGAADWYSQPMLDWALVPGPPDTLFEADRARVAEATDGAVESFPPAALLSYLGRLARRTRSPLVVYSCVMWGGAVESEQAWIVGTSQLAIVNRAPDEPGQVVIVERTAPIRIVEGDVLSRALAHLGAVLPTPHFLPHTRSFPWKQYRLAST